MFLTNYSLQHKFSKKLRRSIPTGYSQFMSGDENGADPSYVGNDDVNTFYGDVIVVYPVPVVGNGIAQSLYWVKHLRYIKNTFVIVLYFWWRKYI